MFRLKIKKIFFKLLFTVMLVYAGSNAYAQIISVEQSVSSDRVEIREFVNFQVVVSGRFSELENPTIPLMSDFVVFFAGREHTTTPAGVDTITFSYTLAPRTHGNFQVNEFTINYQGQAYQTQAFDIEVVRPGEADRVASSLQRSDGGRAFVRARVDSTAVFVNQRITYNVRFYTNMELATNPMFTPPMFVGFWNNASTPTTGYTLIDGINYLYIDVRARLYPVRTGELNIESAELSISALDIAPSTGNIDATAFFQALMGGARENHILYSNTVRVTVFPLPEHGRPENFSGAVGRFSARSFVDRRRVVVNEPFTLTVAIAGDGNIHGISDPVVNLNENEFLIFEPTRNVSSTANPNIFTKVFRYRVVPRTYGRLSIPSIEFSYFDLDRLDYVTLTTAPIEIEVGRGTHVARVLEFEGTQREVGIGIRSAKIIRSISGFQPRNILDSAWFSVIVIINLLFVMYALGYRLYVYQIELDSRTYRRRRAYRSYKKYLKLAGKYLQKEDVSSFYFAINEACFEFIKFVTDKDAKALLRDKIYALLKQHSVSEETIQKLDYFFVNSDYSRYSSALSDSHALKQTMEDFNIITNVIIKDMEKII